jgi:putative MATE family efflux protein
MLITAVYNMADTFFVGRINNSATGAVGVVMSFMAIIQAFGFLFGHGSGNYISRQLGRQNEKAAREMAATGFFSSFIFGIFLSVLGFVFLQPIVRLLGSTDTISPYAMEYMRYILIGAPFMTASFTLNNQLRFQGNAFLGMVGITAGGLLNIVLDPIFIFTLEFGIGGAAIATVISQIFSFCILLAMTFRKDTIHIRFSHFSLKTEYYKEMIVVGCPSLFRQGLSSVANIALNFTAGMYGDAAVAGMSVVGRIMMFAVSALIGYGQGFQPICGFNYGAGLYHRITKTFWFCVKTAGCVLIALSVVGFMFAPQLVGFFRDDPMVIEIGAKALRCQCVTFPLSTWIILCNMMVQNLRLPFSSVFLATARQGLFFIPLVLLLTYLFGLNGLVCAQAVADALTFMVALPIGLRTLKKLKEHTI